MFRIADWFNDKKHDIKDQLFKDVKNIKDEHHRDHVVKNFNERWDHLNNWANDHTKNKWTSRSFDDLPATIIPKKKKFGEDTIKQFTQGSHPQEHIDNLVSALNRRRFLSEDQNSAAKQAFNDIIDRMDPNDTEQLFSRSIGNVKFDTLRKKHGIDVRHKVLENTLTSDNKEQHKVKFLGAIQGLPESQRGPHSEWAKLFREHLTREAA
jgi:hypothetical protein